MSEIQILDKTFVPYILDEQIQKEIYRIASEINTDYKDKNPLFIGILNGCFIFASDLYKNITLASEISFVKLASYQGTNSTGNVITAIGMDKDIAGREIILIEDIIDTGNTLSKFIEHLNKNQAKSISVVTLLNKIPSRQHFVDVKYCGFEIENKFVVGYGLDYDGYGRNTKDIYILK